MDIFSFDCHDNRLPGPRFTEIWEYLTGAQEVFLLLIVKGSKISRFIEIIYFRIKSVKYEEFR
jgi:hypothetical protein